MIHVLGGKAMEESILISIKKMLGIDKDDTSFDQDILVHINSTFSILYQLGVGDADFAIEDDSTTWGDYLSSYKQLNTIKTYIYCKVRKIFDPPQSGSTMESLNSVINELEWRINVAVDPKEETA